MATESIKIAEGRARQQVVLLDHDLEEAKKLVAPLRGDFEFHLTISASDALQLLDRHAIAAIVAGQKLFSGTGLETLVEARKRAPRTTRILLADAADRRVIEEANAQSGLLFQILKRPVTAQQLKDSLSNAMQASAWSARVQPEDTGEVEHIVMETAEHPILASEAANVPVTVLTTDADLYEAIRNAVQERHEAFLATRLEDATEFASTGRCPVLITDQALAQPALQRITRHLHTHEPALVTIAVGTREQGNALMGLLSSGAIHRFLLKPVTSGLARLAIESAARHHESLKSHPRTDPIPNRHAAPPPKHSSRTDPLPAPVEAPAGKAARPALKPELPAETAQNEPVFELRPGMTAPPSTGARNFGATAFRIRKPLVLGIGIAAVAMIGFAIWWWLSNRAPALDPKQQAIQTNLTAAVQAFDAGRFVEPADKSAAHYYQEALKLDPKNATAAAGLDALADRYIDQTESLMVDGRVDDAAKALEVVRALRPEHRRLRFLDTTLRKEQQDRLLQQARESATAGNIDKAQELLNEAARVVPTDRGEVSAAKEAIEAREKSQLAARELDLARQRIAQGRLVNPPNDSAKSHLRAAQQAEPNNLAVQQGFVNLGQRVVQEATQAIARNQQDSARTWIREAKDLGVANSEIERLQNSLDSAQEDSSKNSLLQLVLKRTDENKLFEPLQDNARFYLDRLRQTDPQYSGVKRAVDTLGAKLVANARQAIEQKEFDEAARLIGEARQIGYQSPDLGNIDDILRAARAAPIPPKVPKEVAPRRVRYVAPEYPREALLDGIEGWVDVSFNVTPAGDVVDVQVDGASRRNMFERAAANAVRQWKFEQRQVDDPDFKQRVKTRVEFRLKKP
jgi:protein TonB